MAEAEGGELSLKYPAELDGVSLVEEKEVKTDNLRIKPYWCACSESHLYTSSLLHLDLSALISTAIPNWCSLVPGKVLFFKLNTSYLSNYIQIKIRYDPNHSDAFCFRLFKAVPFSVIMISVTFSHKKQEPPRLKFGACFACTVDSTLQKSCFTHIYEKLLHTHLW